MYYLNNDVVDIDVLNIVSLRQQKMQTTSTLHF